MFLGLSWQPNTNPVHNFSFQFKESRTLHKTNPNTPRKTRSDKTDSSMDSTSDSDKDGLARRSMQFLERSVEFLMGFLPSSLSFSTRSVHMLEPKIDDPLLAS